LPIRLVSVRWNESEAQRSTVAVEGEDVFDTALIGEDAGRVIHERNLLVVVIFELCGRSLECRLPDRDDVDTV